MKRFEDLEYVVLSGACAIGMTKKVKKEFDKLAPDKRAAFGRLFEVYSEERAANLVETQFKFEKRLRVKGTHKEVAIYAFKQFKIRMYGTETDGQFIITECCEKKQNKADLETLERAAANLAQYL